MIFPWLVYVSALGAAIAVIALLLERIAKWYGSPTRWVWLAAILVIVALPAALNLALPAPDPVASTPTPVVPGLVPIHRARYSRINIDGTVLALWFLASAALSVRIVGGALALRRRRKSWIAARLSGVEVLVADELGPAVIGWTKLTTVIPRWALTFNERSRALMLEHEAQHAQSGDPYLRSVALVALIVMPWNPALWWAMRRLRLAVEMDCDQRVLARGVDPREYASLLLAVGERMSATPFAWATALGGSRSFLERRVIAMTTRLGPRYRRLAMAGVGAVIVALIAIACAAPVPDSLVTTANTEAPTHAKASTGYEIVADTLLFTCQDSPEARADTACARGPRVFVNYRRRGSDTFVAREDRATNSKEPLAHWRIEIPSVTGASGRSSDHGRVQPLAFDDGRDDLEVVDSIRACSAAQKAAASRQRILGRVAGEWYYKRCE